MSEPRLKLRWTRVDPNGPGLALPAKEGDVGYDLSAAHDVSLLPGQALDIETNVRVSLPTAAWGEIRARSSIVRYGLAVEAGVLDTNYTGRLYVLIRNMNLNRHHLSDACDDWGRVAIKRGQRIAQLILHRRYDGEYEVGVEEVNSLEDDPRRGSAGFGSSGTGLEDVRGVPSA